MNGHPVIDPATTPRLTVCRTPEELAPYSARISSWLHKLERDTDGFYTAEKVAERFRDGVWQCWVVLVGDEVQGLGATAVFHDDSERLVCMPEFFTGKGFNEWSGLFSIVEDWARQAGCHKARTIARKGYANRALKDWKITHYVFEKAL